MHEEYIEIFKQKDNFYIRLKDGNLRTHFGPFSKAEIALISFILKTPSQFQPILNMFNASGFVHRKADIVNKLDNAISESIEKL